VRRAAAWSALAAALAAVLAAPAAALLNPDLRFSKKAARPGTKITAVTRAPLPRRGEPYALYLVPRQFVRARNILGDPNVRSLGAVTRDDRGRGRLVFRVPKVKPGIYIALLACEELYCGPSGLLNAGPFPGGFTILR
jgi:hypothetical protein